MINDALGLGRVLPIDKLIDIVASVTGRLSKSYFERKDIDTKAYEIRKLAEAKSDEIKLISSAVKENFELTGGIEYNTDQIAIYSQKELPKEIYSQTALNNPTLEDRVYERLNFQEAKKQLNIENVTSYAAEELKNEKEIIDEPIDEEWKTRFFNIAADISSDELQALWGKILAGEIKHPKSYSLRTLEFLKNLSKEEAEVFSKFAKIKIIAGDTHFVVNADRGAFIETEFGIKFSDCLLLTELGLIVSDNSLAFSFKETNNNKTTDLFIYGQKGIVIYRNENTPTQSVEILMLTKIGVDLSKLVQQTHNENYIKKICSKFVHPNVKIEYGDLIELQNNQYVINNKIEYK